MDRNLLSHVGFLHTHEPRKSSKIMMPSRSVRYLPGQGGRLKRWRCPIGRLTTGTRSYCNRTATGPVCAGTQRTSCRLQPRKMPAKQQNRRTHQNGPEHTSWLLHGGGQGFESPPLHSEMLRFAGKTWEICRCSGACPGLRTATGLQCGFRGVFHTVLYGVLLARRRWEKIPKRSLPKPSWSCARGGPNGRPSPLSRTTRGNAGSYPCRASPLPAPEGSSGARLYSTPRSSPRPGTRSP